MTENTDPTAGAAPASIPCSAPVMETDHCSRGTPVPPTQQAPRTGCRLAISWRHFWWHLDSQFQANCGVAWRAEFFISFEMAWLGKMGQFPAECSGWLKSPDAEDSSWVARHPPAIGSRLRVELPTSQNGTSGELTRCLCGKRVYHAGGVTFRVLSEIPGAATKK